MFFDKPMVFHSKQPDGRHWLTTLDFPPLQILPVAPNHCRAGHFLATVISAKLAESETEVPEVIRLSRAEAESAYGQSLDFKGEAEAVRIRLVPMEAPKGVGDEEDEDPAQFITPQPPEDWKDGYDSWIVAVGRMLGLEVPEPSDEKGYEKAMADATADVQKLLPALRTRFLAGMGGLNLGFKVGLKTRKGGKEFVWVRPTDWSDETKVVCVLESQPQDCKGFKLGQRLTLATSEVLDYVIGAEGAGVVESGPTQRIAEDYGLVLP